MHLKKNKFIYALIRWWSGKNLPDQHIYIFSRENKKKSVLFRSLVIHPVKRRTAKCYLFILKKFFGVKVVGITGSAGKTTTKEILAKILGKEAPTVYSYANIDPVYNIPTTILKARPWTKYVVLEMGIEYKGEMSFYTWLARPDIGVITNIAPVHTQFLDSEEGVLKEKSVLVKSLKDTNFAVLNYGNKYLRNLKGIKSKVLWFNKDVTASKIRLGLDGTGFLVKTKNFKKKFKIPIIGRQFVDNALAAIAVAQVLGISAKTMQSGLADFHTPDHRMKVIKHASGCVVIDDSYNSNPLAVKMAIDAFYEIPGFKKRTLVLGDMLELGQKEVEYHQKIARHINENLVSKVICVGDLSHHLYTALKKRFNKRVVWVKDSRQALSLVKHSLVEDNLILIKGSRSIGLDYIANNL